MGALLGLAPGAQAAFPGLNGKIAFFRTDDSGQSSVFTMNPDGTGQTNLNNDPSHSDVDPAYSADGKLIAFANHGSGPPVGIWVMNADGSGKRQVSDTPAADVGYFHPGFSPDGTKIAFESNDSSNTNDRERIVVVNVDGTGQHDLLTPPAGSEDEGAAFSPDGTKIAFMREPTNDQGGQVMVANADGTGTATPVTNPPAGMKDSDPNFSPDGTKIAFGRSPLDSQLPQAPGRITLFGASDIYVINTNGTGEQNLTNGFVSESENPVFSPDGTMIAFRGNNQVYTMRADGTGKQPVSQPPSGTDSDPNWQPLANVASAAQVPPCTGNVTVTISDSTGFKSPPKAARFRLDGGAEQSAPASGNTATINVPVGRHVLEYWGENQAGDQEATHHTATVLVDKTKPHIVFVRDQHRATFRRGQSATVTIKVTDSGGSGLTRNPSRRHLRISTTGLGIHTVRATATDGCGNTATALLRYRVAQIAIAPRRVRFTG